MSNAEQLKEIRKELRRIRDTYEPKSNANVNYHRLSLAITNISKVLNEI